jgi:hypothetical protein
MVRILFFPTVSVCNDFVTELTLPKLQFLQFRHVRRIKHLCRWRTVCHSSSYCLPTKKKRANSHANTLCATGESWTGSGWAMPQPQWVSPSMLWDVSPSVGSPLDFPSFWPGLFSGTFIADFSHQTALGLCSLLP